MENMTPEDQAAHIDRLWAKLDVEKSGSLDLDGLKRGLRKIDHPLQNADKLLEQIVQAVDLNKDGRIQYNEFCIFVRHAELELWKLFKAIDQDSNNALSKDELRAAFTRADIQVPDAKLDAFFKSVDRDHDGQLSFEEWRDFLLFIPTHVPGLRAVLSYYSAGVQVNQEGDVHISDETLHGLGTALKAPFARLFSLFIRHPPTIRHRPPDPMELSESQSSIATAAAGGTLVKPYKDQKEPTIPGEGNLSEQGRIGEEQEAEDQTIVDVASDDTLQSESKPKLVLTSILPSPGYFAAGGLAGMISRTATAPLDRLKVYLIAQTDARGAAVDAVKKGSPLEATKHATRPLVDASIKLWRAGGIQSLFAGNGLNVAKVMPESAIKFGSYEASKRFFATLEGHKDPSKLHPWSQFAAGGMGGIISQACVYPLDTLKFRMQCNTVEGGLHGNKLIIETFKQMWQAGGLRAFYRGLTMGLVGMFPYSAIDLTTFEYTKRWITQRNARMYGKPEEDSGPGPVATAAIGGFSGALGASIVYPLNLLRTRLQTQGTASHPRTYTGIMDVARQTIQGEGVRGLFKGITPNLLKVVPAVSITYVVYERAKKAMDLS